MTNLRTEIEIMQSWNPADKPLVSVACITYNHGKYIEDAIEGFLIQETDFPFEILIHDDASTDNTANIVREYAKKYPNIIKPIFQTENQYSKGKRILPIVTSLCAGDYIAICEGDDYWTDPNKLQIQVEAMRMHPDCYISFHPVERVSNREKLGIMGKIDGKNTIISADYILQNGIAFMATCSLIIDKKSIDNINSDIELNAFFVEYGTSFFIKIYHSLHGGALYIDRIMGTYTVLATGSHGERVRTNIDFNTSWIFYINTAFDIFDELTECKFHKKIRNIQQRRLLSFLRDGEISMERRLDFFRENKGKFSIESKLKWELFYKYNHRINILFCFLKFVKNSLIRSR